MADADEITVVAETRSHSLLRDATGYTVWELQSDSEAPVASFPLTDDGMDEAFDLLLSLGRRRRRERVLAMAGWMVVAVGLVWLVFTAVLVTLGIVGLVQPEALADIADNLTRLFYAIPALPTAFVAAIGVYVILWTQMRSRRGRD